MYGGGVGRNLAEIIWKLYGDIRLISAIGNDDIGRTLNKLLPSQCTQAVQIDPKKSTSICNVIFDNVGDCKLILGDMEIHKTITSNLVWKTQYELFSNLNSDLNFYLCRLSKTKNSYHKVL